MQWVALRVRVPTDITEAVANFMIEAGAPGVITEQRDDASCPAPSGHALLEAHLPAAEHVRFAAALARYLASLAEIDPVLGRVTLETTRLPAIDWTALSRRHHRPLRVGRRLLVAPPWDVPEASGREILVIEPGMAFGTGQHATTRGCLEEIEAAVEAGGVASALDVGTGSGVLALALARLGVARVVALDADPAVPPRARANFERNGAAHLPVFAGTIQAVRGAFDLVVANLLADPLAAEAPALAAAVAPRGCLIVSGFLDAQARTVRAAYPGWRVAGGRPADGWQTLTLVRDG